jgi:hypothetical protein
VVPGGQVTESVVKRILARPDVQPHDSGLFPGCEQTFKLRGDWHPIQTHVRKPRVRTPPRPRGLHRRQQKELIMKRDDIFPSKYLRTPDLKGMAHTVEIERAPVEALKNTKGETQQKPVLYFRGKRKALPLNVTNFDSVATIAGDDETETWPGTRIELYPAKTQMGGRVVDCIRIRQPAQPTTPATRPAVEADDEEVPF